MEGALSLVMLAGASAGLLYSAKTVREKRQQQRTVNHSSSKEGFGVTSPSVARAFSQSHTAFVENSAKKFNPLMNTMDPGKNSLLPPNYTSTDVSNAQNSIVSAIKKVIAKPSEPSYTLSVDPLNKIQVNGAGAGSLESQIAKCEAVKSDDCSKFDDPVFQANCGVCLDVGKNSQSLPHIGGLYVSPTDVDAAKMNAARLKSKNVKYTPSIGSCPSGKFTVTQSQCQKIKNQMLCQKQQNFDITGCSQCVADDSFQYVDPATAKQDVTLVIVGQGKFSVTLGGVPTAQRGTLSSSTQSISLTLMEDSTMTLYVDGETKPAIVAGYIVGTTVSGEYRTDLGMIVTQDTLSSHRPLISGTYEINGQSFTGLKSARGATKMSLTIYMPYSFIDPSEPEALACPAGPYITNRNSASQLNAGPCYAKGSGPGTYSSDCLKSTFINIGCTEAGTAYPSSADSAKKLQTDSVTGKSLAIGQIANTINEMYIRATTGKTSAGTTLSIPDWNSASLFCTGTPVTSPCDTPVKNTGPLSPECLTYLYNNGDSSTYTSGSLLASLSGAGTNQYCTSSGTISPMNPDGSFNSTNVGLAQQQGGVTGVKAYYNQINKRANDNTVSDSARKDAIQQCYGISLETQSPGSMPLDNSYSVQNGYSRPGNLVRAECPVGKYKFGAFAGGICSSQPTNWDPTINDFRDGDRDSMCFFDIEHWKRYLVSIGTSTASINSLVTSYGKKCPPLPNTLDNPLSRQVSPAASPPNFRAPTGQQNPVSELGAYGIAPWYTNWGTGGSRFAAGPTTKWIWSKPGAANNADNNLYTFSTYYTNSGSSQITAYLSVIIDNVGTVYINNVAQVIPTFNVAVKFPPGQSLIQVQAQNQGGPAGMILVIRDAPNGGGNIIVETKGNWTWQ
jgi:hypothetical protein